MRELIKQILKIAVTAAVQSILYNKLTKKLVLTILKDLASKTPTLVDDNIIKKIEEALNIGS